MSALLVVAAIVAWVLGLAGVDWFGATVLDWLLGGLILFATATLVGTVAAVVTRR